MIAEVISIGDELTSGARLDTNSQWLSQRLGELGLRVAYHTTVADDLAANVAVFRLALQRADFVIATGGLGPTADDLTRDALAQATGVELVLDEKSLEHIRGLFARHQREMPERNRLQALFPAGSSPIFNSRGTAPGIWLQAPRAGRAPSQLFALPGVPVEMREMYESVVAPTIGTALGARRVIRHRRLKCFGAGESQVEQMLPDLIRRGREPSVGITVHEATITLRVTAAGATPEECRAAMDPTLATIRECLGNLVFGEEDDELEDAVIRELSARGQTLSVVEWGTCGVLSQWLASASPESGPLVAGTVLRSSAVPTWLGEKAGGRPAVSSEAAADWATRCRQQFQTDYALAIGPFPAMPEGSATAPEYFYALATADKSTVKSATLVSHPAIWKPRAAKLAMNLLRLHLLHAGG